MVRSGIESEAERNRLDLVNHGFPAGEVVSVVPLDQVQGTETSANNIPASATSFAEKDIKAYAENVSVRIRTYAVLTLV
jgi:hypothetical protein